MPETLNAQLGANGLTVHCPAWQAIPGLIHGVTTRQTLPQPGKNHFFQSVRHAREAGALPGGLLTLGAEQVHGENLEVAGAPAQAVLSSPGLAADPENRIGEFAATDALLATLPGVLLVIQTADCLPVFIVDPAARLVGLAHCGWRGLRLGLAGKLAREMAARGAAAQRMQAWLGPAICAGHYEVGQKLVGEFRAAFPGAPVSPEGTHLDLAAVARWQLERAGLAPARILESGECTLGQPERYHSWRGQGEQAGRMMSFIGFTAS